MTNLIKSRDAGSAAVRPLSDVRERRSSQAPEPNPELTRLRAEIDNLSQQLEQRDLEIHRLGGEVSKAFQEGEAAGREAGLKEGDDRGAAARAVLAEGVDRALQQFAGDLSALERLAILVAHEGLDKLLGDAGHHGDLIARVIRNQIGIIEGQSIVSIRVSTQDFADPAAISSLIGAVGQPDLDIGVSKELKAGECRIKLALGALDVGIDQQWSRLSDMLLDAAAPARAAE